MLDILSSTVAGVFGLLLGTLFFGGLWWTVQAGLSSKRPALWLLGSALLRTGIALAGFYAIGRDDWKRLLAALVGFTVARFIVLWRTREIGQLLSAPGKSHAS
ncbi:MAG: ATP synthase subunit I [Gemmatimonadaceae bacterium]